MFKPFRLSLLAVALILGLVSVAPAARPAQARPQAYHTGLNAKPIMGWSSWSLQSLSDSTGYGIGWLNIANIKRTSDLLKQKLGAYGYNQVSIDSGWWQTSAWHGGAIAGDLYDSYGRPRPEPNKFPNGVTEAINYIHANGQKAGFYYVVGLPKAVYDANPPIMGTSCRARDIAVQPLRNTNGWQDHWAINFSNSCAQAYINSIANLFASWQIDYLKLDGVTNDNIADVQAWHTAIGQSGRAYPMGLSWWLDVKNAAIWKANASQARIDNDVECYCGTTLVNWNNASVRWQHAPQWASYVDSTWKNDLDTMNVGNGTTAPVDGLTQDERRSVMTLWAISAAPMYIGDDLAKLDSFGLSLLTNTEVIAQNQTGKPARPVSQASSQQVWWVQNADNTRTVALFNLGSSAATVTASFSSFGLSGNQLVRDMWSKTDLGSFSGSWSASVPAHGVRLIKLSQPGAPTATPLPTATSTPAGPTATPTAPATATPTAPATATPTAPATATPSPTPGSGAACSPVTATVTAPFSYDGAGTFCWQISSIPNYINSWNLTSLTINGVSFANIYAVPSNLPPKINGFWYISYSGQYAWSHFEAK